jgi:hypothetical protein
MATSGLTVSFSVVSGSAVLSGNILTLTGTGLVTVRASQSGNAMYAAATDVDQSFMVVSGANTITDWGQGADGNFRFTFAGEFDRQYVIEVSSDLANWTALATNVVDSLGNIQFIDSAGTHSGARYYRMVAP